ncbi:hypothetical protein [Naasia sp. SYSU D00948]|uniref:hypothetical protein n=1 Tax=Naasia sp. SYSU D00948 TaxID=2817379 RepID=UPI001B30469A|nr:hypothetical protein [Naasia sp. SYSU D00948]
MRHGTRLVVHPMWGRFASTATAAISLTVLPPFLALYWLTIPTGDWMLVLAIHAVTLAVVIPATLRVRHAVIEIDEHEVRERGYFGRLVVTPRADIGSVLVVPVLAGSTLDSSVQLFVLDREGRTRVRMRGQYWSEEALTAVEHAFDVPVKRVPAPITRRELRARYGPNLYWHERHPALTFTAVAALCTAVATPVFVAIEQLI